MTAQQKPQVIEASFEQTLRVGEDTKVLSDFLRAQKWDMGRTITTFAHVFSATLLKHKNPKEAEDWLLAATSYMMDVIAQDIRRKNG